MGEAAALLRDGSRQGHGGDRGRRDAVAPPQIAANKWLPDDELRVYSGGIWENRFSGRAAVVSADRRHAFAADLQLFAGQTIDQPSMFIAGKSDWGAYQHPARWNGCSDRLHADGGGALCRWRRPLGAAGAAGAGRGAAARLPRAPRAAAAHRQLDRVRISCTLVNDSHEIRKARKQFSAPVFSDFAFSWPGFFHALSI